MQENLMSIDPHIQARWDRAVEGRQEQVAASAVWFTRLIAQMADLRAEGGCPWDREQSLASLRQYVREEADEVCRAIDDILELENRLRREAGLPEAQPAAPQGEDSARTEKKGHTIAHHPQHTDFKAEASASGAPLPDLNNEQEVELAALYARLIAELGDLFLQPVFMGDILTGRGMGGAEAALESIVRKLIHRHPHVYGNTEVSSSAEVLANWEKLKEREQQATERQ
jgi:NTP pyrophosphatase (non-canonical NTP hydrolase)